MMRSIVTAALVVALGAWVSSCTKRRHDSGITSTVEVSLVPSAALSESQAEEDARVIARRIRALGLKNVSLEHQGNRVELSFCVIPSGRQGNRALSRIYQVVAHTGRWSVHPVAPLPAVDDLPHDIGRALFLGIETLTSHHRKDLERFLSSLGQPYPYRWIMGRSSTNGRVTWHAFLVGPPIRSVLKEGHVSYAAGGKAVLLVDDDPWASGDGGRIVIGDPALFAAVTDGRLHVPWKVAGVSSTTSLAR